MRTRRKPKPRFEPAATVTAWQSFCTGTHGEIVVREGTTLLGDHPAVLAYPDNFVLAGTPRDQWPDPRTVRLSTEPDPADEPTTRIPQPVPLSEQMVATASWLEGIGHGLMVVNVGDRVHKDDDLVKRYPDRFRPAVQS